MNSKTFYYLQIRRYFFKTQISAIQGSYARSLGFPSQIGTLKFVVRFLFQLDAKFVFPAQKFNVQCIGRLHTYIFTFLYVHSQSGPFSLASKILNILQNILKVLILCNFENLVCITKNESDIQQYHNFVFVMQVSKFTVKFWDQFY